MLFCRLLIFFQNQLFFRKIISGIRLGPDQARRTVGHIELTFQSTAMVTSRQSDNLLPNHTFYG